MKTILTRVTPSQDAALREITARKRITITTAVRKAIADYITKEEIVHRVGPSRNC